MNDLVNKDQMLVFLAASGKSNPEIAEILGIDRSTVRLKLQDSRMQFEVKHMRYKLYGSDHKKRFSEILPHAIDVTEQILKDPNAKQAVRFAAAQEVMDRTLGKPKQTIDHQGSLFRDLIEKLDGKEKEKPIIDVSNIMDASVVPMSENPNERILADPTTNPNLEKDSIDQWAAKNL